MIHPQPRGRMIAHHAAHHAGLEIVAHGGSYDLPHRYAAGCRIKGNIGTVVDTYKNIGEKEKKEIKDILKILVKTSFHTLKEVIPTHRDNKRK